MITFFIPIYNEGEKIIKLFQEFNLNVKTKYRILLCYDNDDDNVFQQKDKFKNFNFVKEPISDGILLDNLLLCKYT